MTAHRTVPSEVDPRTVADLIADAWALPPAVRVRPPLLDLTTARMPRVLRIPDRAVRLVPDDPR